MLEALALTKSFPAAKPRKRRAEPNDPRERGRWFCAVDGISFKVELGQIFGLLGPNGAGKTTLLRMLSTVLKPTAGTVLCDGVDSSKHPLEIRRRTGFLSGNTGLYGRLTARELLVYYGRLHGLDRGQLESRLEQMTDFFDMGSFLDRRNDSLSSGMRQKVSICRSLIHDPEILLFDELTTGLDVAASEGVLTTVERCRERGKTIVFSTHHMDEVDRLCDRLLILARGRTCFEGTVAAMRAQSGEARLDRAFLHLMDPRNRPDHA